MLNNVEISTKLTSEKIAKIAKIEKEIAETQNLLAYNYLFTVLIIPWAIFWTR